MNDNISDREDDGHDDYINSNIEEDDDSATDYDFDDYYWFQYGHSVHVNPTRHHWQFVVFLSDF